MDCAGEWDSNPRGEPSAWFDVIAMHKLKGCESLAIQLLKKTETMKAGGKCVGSSAEIKIPLVTQDG